METLRPGRTVCTSMVMNAFSLQPTARVRSPGEEREHVYKVHAPGGLLVQIVRGEQGGTIADQAVLYIHGDRQGSPAIIRDQEGGDHGSPVWSSIGTPAGDVSWESSDPIARTVRTTYTGHEFDEELGLTNMGGRIYDQNVGRFMQPDPALVALFNTQGLNGYSYVYNLPTGFTDPTGLSADDDDDEPPPPTDGIRRRRRGQTATPMLPTCHRTPIRRRPRSWYAEAAVRQDVRGGSQGPSNGAPPSSNNGDFSPGSAQFQAGLPIGGEGMGNWEGPRIAPPRPGLPPGYGPTPGAPLGEGPPAPGEEPPPFIEEGPGPGIGRMLGWVVYILLNVTGDTPRVQAAAGPRNQVGKPYPQVRNPGSGNLISPPPPGLNRVPVDQRVPWGFEERGSYIKEWYDRGFPTPSGGWADYDVHHIIPREYGGTNDFENLVPVERSIHQNEFKRMVEGLLMHSVVSALSRFRNDDAVAQTNQESPFRLASSLSAPAASEEIAAAWGGSDLPVE